MFQIQLTHLPFFSGEWLFTFETSLPSSTTAQHFVYNLSNLFMSSGEFEVLLSFLGSFFFAYSKHDTEKLNKKLPRVLPVSFNTSQFFLPPYDILKRGWSSVPLHNDI